MALEIKKEKNKDNEYTWTGLTRGKLLCIHRTTKGLKGTVALDIHLFLDRILKEEGIIPKEDT